MNSFKIVNKIFVRSNNETYKILRRYTISLSLFLLFIISFHIYQKEYSEVLNLIKTVLVTTGVNFIFQYIVNVIRHKGIKSLKENNILGIAVIISIITYQEKLLISVIAILISCVVRLINRNINFSSVLYGLLFVVIYKQYYLQVDTPLINFINMNNYGGYDQAIGLYGGIKGFLFGTNLYYLSPFLCVVVFGYLFYKKSIKYPTVVSYLTTFIIIMFMYGLLKGMNIWFVFFQITTGNILFLSIYALSDYRVTPVTQEGQTLYGMILAILTVILRFIIPELAVIIPLILGPIVLTKYLDNISYKLKTNNKLYRFLTISCILVAILVTTIIYIVY